jgi:predicted RNA-binding Zn-ribbon protein involved in translation (DUF1610 family)
MYDDQDYDDAFEENPEFAERYYAARNAEPTHPCPQCGTENVLNDDDVRRGYRCDACADEAER